jgi:hypothetical protein
MADTESSVALILGKASAISIPVTCPLGPSSQIVASFQAAYGVRPFKLRELLFRVKIITSNRGKHETFGRKIFPIETRNPNLPPYLPNGIETHSRNTRTTMGKQEVEQARVPHQNGADTSSRD